MTALITSLTLVSNKVSVVECEFLPSLYMEGREGLECSLTCEKLEAALSVLDPSHTKEPHQEVKAIHKECTKHRSLWQGHKSGYLKVRRTSSTTLWSLSRQNRQTDLSHRVFLQVSSGTAGNRHILLNVQTGVFRKATH